jgi:hypothetical protein
MYSLPYITKISLPYIVALQGASCKLFRLLLSEEPLAGTSINFWIGHKMVESILLKLKFQSWGLAGMGLWDQKIK